MNCPNCGHEVHGRFCTNCGTRIEESPAEAPQAGGDPNATSVIRPGSSTYTAVTGMAAQQPSPAPAAAPRQEQPSPAPSAVGGPATGASSWTQGPSAPPPPTPVQTAPSTPQLSMPGGFAVPENVQQMLAPLEGAGKQILAWAGCVLLIVGLFVSAKTYSVSIGGFGSVSGSRSLWDYGTFWAVILLLLTLASAGLAFIRDYKWLLVTGGASLIILIINFLYAFSSGISFVSSHPSWGWILLFPGALLILAAGATRPTPRDAADDNGLNNLIASLTARTGSR